MAYRTADYLPSRSDLADWRDRGLDAARDYGERGWAAARDGVSTLTVRGPCATDVAKGLGWFSLLLGATEMLGGRALSRGTGVAGGGTMRFFGAREIASGLAILMKPYSPARMWLRVAGDAVDIATLSTGLRRDNPKRNVAKVALATVLVVTAIDIACAARLRR